MIVHFNLCFFLQQVLHWYIFLYKQLCSVFCFRMSTESAWCKASGEPSFAQILKKNISPKPPQQMLNVTFTPQGGNADDLDTTGISRVIQITGQ